MSALQIFFVQTTLWVPLMHEFFIKPSLDYPYNIKNRYQL
jgi:hypothetical protein